MIAITADDFKAYFDRGQFAYSESGLSAEIDARIAVDLTGLLATDYTLNLGIDGGLQEDFLIGTIDSSSLAAALASLNTNTLVAQGASFNLSGLVTAALSSLLSLSVGVTSSLVIGTPASGTDLAPLLFLFGSAQGVSQLLTVRNKDITAAIAEALAVFNPGLWPDDPTGNQALEYLTAHFLQLDIEAATSQGQPKLVQTARSANGISESLDIPDWMKQDELSQYSTTYYGQKYLYLAKPYLDGAVFSVAGQVNP